MKRRTLDLAFSIGGALFAVLLLVLGLVLKDQGSFADDYVSRELAAQKIYFTPADFLSDSEKEAACLVEYGTVDGDTSQGQLLSTGKMAECYAQEYIGLHMREDATEKGYDGATYASMGKFVRPGSGPDSIPDQIAAAEEAGDTAKVEELTAELDEARALRTQLQQGETLRGLLLTVYGFSVFGEKADLAAVVCYAGAALLFLLSVAGFVHASTKSAKEHVIE